MNKQRFLAELRRLLVFMTESDRSITMELYTARFDRAGEAGEEKLLEQLGTPTKLAIELSRGYKPGQITVEENQRRELQQEEQKAKTVSAEEYDPGAVDADIALFPADKSEEKPAAAEDEPGAETAEEDETEAEPEDEGGEFLPNNNRSSRPTVYRRQGASVSRGAGIALLTAVLLLLGLPLALLGIIIAAVLLCPGAAGIFGAGLVAIGALWCIGYVADAFVLLGAAFIVLAAALLLLFGGAALGIRLVKLYIRAVTLLCDALLGKKVAVE